MSADNAIVILDLPLKDFEKCEYVWSDREYYVAHMQATEDLVDKNPGIVWGIFGKCQPLDLAGAWTLADKMAKDCPVLEYGIINVSLPRTMDEYKEAATENKNE